MTGGYQRDGDGDEPSLLCSLSIRLNLLVDSAAPAEPADNVVYRGRRRCGYRARAAGDHAIISTALSLLWLYHPDVRKRSARCGRSRTAMSRQDQKSDTNGPAMEIRHAKVADPMRIPRPDQGGTATSVA